MFICSLDEIIYLNKARTVSCEIRVQVISFYIINLHEICKGG